MERGQTATPYQLEITSKAERSLSRLDRPTLERMRERVDALSEDPFAGKLLRGPLQGKRSLRVGNYRIIYQIDLPSRKILIEDIGHRREVSE